MVFQKKKTKSFDLSHRLKNLGNIFIDQDNSQAFAMALYFNPFNVFFYLIGVEFPVLAQEENNRMTYQQMQRINIAEANEICSICMENILNYEGKIA